MYIGTPYRGLYVIALSGGIRRWAKMAILFVIQPPRQERQDLSFFYLSMKMLGTYSVSSHSKWAKQFDKYLRSVVY